MALLVYEPTVALQGDDLRPLVDAGVCLIGRCVVVAGGASSICGQAVRILGEFLGNLVKDAHKSGTGTAGHWPG